MLLHSNSVLVEALDTVKTSALQLYRCGNRMSLAELSPSLFDIERTSFGLLRDKSLLELNSVLGIPAVLSVLFKMSHQKVNF